jgi:hexulose-6-phosphate isomerase
MSATTRRDFLALGAAFAAAAGPRAEAQRLPIRKAILMGMLPKELSVVERFQLAREVGFEQVECRTTPDESAVEEIGKAAKTAGLRIHSVMNANHWESPLSSPDAAVVKLGVQGIETSLRNAHAWGADTVLVVPAVVDARTAYRDAWERSQKQLRTLIPLARELKVILALENVWNKFLLSPLEFARYVDEFESPWVRAYFDVGNVVLYGYPQDWIRTLGKRIVKVHLKDFQFKPDPVSKKQVADWAPLREGAIDWKEIHQALAEIGYSGSATVELPGGDANYLREVSHRVDLILSGA